MQQTFPLHTLPIGEYAVVDAVLGAGPMHDRLLELGFCEEACVSCLFPSLLGDPRAYRIKETTIALRQSDAQNILCRSDRGGK